MKLVSSKKNKDQVQSTIKTTRKYSLYYHFLAGQFGRIIPKFHLVYNWQVVMNSSVVEGIG